MTDRWTDGDRAILRDVAAGLAETAAEPRMAERRRRWMEHNSLRSTHPMILLFPEGSWYELLPESSLRCETDEARGIERSLRSRIYTVEHFQDDTVAEAEWVQHAVVSDTGWGLEPSRRPSTEARGAFAIEPVLTDPSDLKKLHYPELAMDEAATARNLERMRDLFGDILEVKDKGRPHISYHLWSQYLHLRGASEMLMDMVDRPDFVHEVMTFFEEGHHRLLRQMQEMNLLCLNNDGTYHNSGGNGYTDELPASGFDPERVRPCDIWASAEAQELAAVSPEMHNEFALQYEKRLLEPFGLTGYGCCEDLTRKLDYVLQIPGIRRISCSPWADVDACAEKLKGNAIFSWKPNPAHLVGHFDPDALRTTIGHTLEAAREHGCVLEMVLKDTHTCEHHPERFDEWTRIARELVDELA